MSKMSTVRETSSDRFGGWGPMRQREFRISSGPELSKKREICWKLDTLDEKVNSFEARFEGLGVRGVLGRQVGRRRGLLAFS